MYRKHIIGKLGEKYAQKYILKLGYNIIEKNLRTKFGEIDIIAKNKREIIFIEVKTRTNTKYGLPIESITKQKIRRIYNSAKYYLNINNLENKMIRFDVIEVYIKENKVEKINHIKSI